MPTEENSSSKNHLIFKHCHEMFVLKGDVQFYQNFYNIYQYLEMYDIITALF